MKMMKINKEIKKMNGYLMLKMMFSVLLTHMLDIVVLWKK